MDTPDLIGGVPQDFTAAQWTPSEAVFAFAAWLTARQELLGFEVHWDAPLTALALEFSRQHALPLPRHGHEIVIVPFVRPSLSAEK